MGQNWSISDPNGVPMGSNGFPYQFGSIRTNSQPKWTHGDPKQSIFHFFRVSILDISDGSGELFRKCSEKWVRYLLGTELPHRRELQIDGVEMSNGATAAIFRPDKLLGAKSTAPLSQKPTFPLKSVKNLGFLKVRCQKY